MTANYSYYEASNYRWSAPAGKSNSVAALKNDYHTATNPCRWVIAEGKRVVAASDDKARASWEAWQRNLDLR